MVHRSVQTAVLFLVLQISSFLQLGRYPSRQLHYLVLVNLEMVEWLTVKEI